MDNLCPELATLICNYITNKNDLCFICLTSKKWRDIAEAILYQDIVFDDCKPLDDCYDRYQKIDRYCTRATFVINGHRDEGVRLNLAELVVPDPNGDAVFRYLDYLSKVRELRFRGEGEFNFGRLANSAHGFRCLARLRLHGPFSCPPHLHLALQAKDVSCCDLPFEHAKNLFSVCRSLESFKLNAKDDMPEIDIVNPYQLITTLAPHKKTLRYLEIDYGLLLECYISLPQNEPRIVGNLLVDFTALCILIIEYDAFFGGEKFVLPVIEQITGEILPPSILRLEVIKCPPKYTSENSLYFIVAHMERHSSLEDVTIDWCCDEGEKDTIDSAALHVLEDARRRGLVFRITYWGADEAETT